MGKKGDLSPCKKAEVKALVIAKFFSNSEISRRLKVSEASVRRIKKKIESGEELCPPPKRKNATASLFSPQDLNFKTYRPARKPMFTSAMKAKPLNWAKQWCDKDVDFWRSLEEWFPNGEPYISLQDGAPCHTARPIKAFLAEQNIPLLDWPGNSPDMNPIENVWELMKREVAKYVITNKTQLLERIIHLWNHHPQMQETVQSCIDSMPRRIEALIAAKGGSTKY
ncbi:transposable element Tcb2 transposase [Trichonephila clavipes]|nr:transposable element Tcb2 transposase [Trichonephila clavipes]